MIPRVGFVIGNFVVSNWEVYSKVRFKCYGMVDKYCEGVDDI